MRKIVAVVANKVTWQENIKRKRRSAIPAKKRDTKPAWCPGLHEAPGGHPGRTEEELVKVQGKEWPIDGEGRFQVVGAQRERNENRVLQVNLNRTRAATM